MKSSTKAPELVTSHWLNTPAPISLHQLIGKVVVIEAFQMLCPGCVSHGLPLASRIRQTFSAEDVVVIGLHTVFEHHPVQGAKAALKAFVQEYKIDFPIGVDAPQANQSIPQTMERYQLRGTPSLILIDRAGRYRQTFFGAVPDLAIGAAIMNLVMDRPANRSESGSNQSVDTACTEQGCRID